MKKIIYTVTAILTIVFIFGFGNLTSNASADITSIENIDPSSSKVEIPSSGINSINMYCCKICKKGKACGDSCINKNYTCHQPPGCACNG